MIESDRNAWRERRACRDMSPALFYPGRGELAPEANATCARCPVRSDCLEYALEQGEYFGIWGGESERGRKRLRRERLRSAA